MKICDRNLDNFVVAILLIGMLTLSTRCFGQVGQAIEELLQPPDLANDESLSLLLRIPESFIAKSVNRDFQHSAPVQRELMGTRSHGIAVCRGSVTCELADQANGAMLCCHIVGSVESMTSGVNGPATIDAVAKSNYKARKCAVFDGRRFTSSPATIESSTKLIITGIGSRLPGIRGRIVRRVASKRAAESHDQAESITTNLTAQELCHRIDADFDERIRVLNDKLETSLSILEQLEITGEKLTIRSVPDCIEVGVLAKTDNGEMTLADERRPVGDSIELWISLGSGKALKNLTLLEFTSIAPRWLSVYFSKHPRLSQLDKKIAVDFEQNWIVLNLQK